MQREKRGEKEEERKGGMQGHSYFYIISDTNQYALLDRTQHWKGKKGREREIIKI